MHPKREFPALLGLDQNDMYKYSYRISISTVTCKIIDG
jgi:hypothetical protein